ncbi:MAG: hypothetical protein LBD46_01685 [Endomicrobium sp.]|jgi:hypothetical protein|nr:hypothetical protein [Endomicrobium sp.]
MSFLKKLVKDVKNIPLYCKSLNFKSLLLFIKYPRFVRRSILDMGAVFDIKDNNLIIVLQKHGFSFWIDNISNLAVVYEIFYEQVYKKIIFRINA